MGHLFAFEDPVRGTFGRTGDPTALEKNLQTWPIGTVHQKRWCAVDAACRSCPELQPGQFVLMVPNAKGNVLLGHKMDVIARLDGIMRLMDGTALNLLDIAVCF